MKVQNLFWAALALMCAILFSASCKSTDPDNGGKGDDEKATQAMVNVSFQVSEDMTTYLDMKFYVTGVGANNKELIINKDLLKPSTSENFKYYTIPVVATLPGTGTIKTKVTVKEGVDIAKVEKLYFYKGFLYQYGLYAGEKQLSQSGVESKISMNPSTSTGPTFKALMDKGSVNQELSFTFDASGNCTFKHN